MYDLDRFVKAQEKMYDIALNEIKNGKKISHFMWYIFPQLKGLGYSDISNYYGISGLDEAKEYLEDEILGNRLYNITLELLKIEEDNPINIFGNVDALKLKSSMTLFDIVSDDEIFYDVLKKYYGGKKDERTIALLGKKKMR